MGVSFETYLRRREDAPMRRRCYVLLRRRHEVPIRCRGDVSLRRPGNVPLRHRWVFHLRCTCGVAETYRETLLRRRHDVLLPGGSFVTFVLPNCNIYILLKKIVVIHFLYFNSDSVSICFYFDLYFM